MKFAAAALVLVALVGGTAMAEDGNISQADISAFGLSGMQQVDDAEGMQVRGRFLVFGGAAGSFAFTATSASNSNIGGFGLVLGTDRVFASASTSSNAAGIFGGRTSASSAAALSAFGR